MFLKKIHLALFFTILITWACSGKADTMDQNKEHQNRLAQSQSPYLLQHASNPVDWYPWGKEAFLKAKKENKPIFLSIGYSTCHWCHVMEHESFEDSTVAALMNEHFISIKVDREEMPEVDHLYMSVCQAMTGRGGWPLTIVMTPDKEPFFAGTYFPKNGRGKRPGMLQLIPSLANAWTSKQGEILKTTERVRQYLEKANSSSMKEAWEEDMIREAFSQYASRYDPDFGGFGRAPKFPSPHNLIFLLRYSKLYHDTTALKMAKTTLQHMRRGGMYDHIGLGFHRYSTDKRWFLPHFEKMLYDQAMLAMAYLEAYQYTRDEQYSRVAEEIFTYVLRDMTDKEGGFYSAEDADSEGEEGKFYVWNMDEFIEILGQEAGETLSPVGARRFGLQPVEHRIGQLCRRLEMGRLFVLGDVDDGAFHIVDHRPVHEHDIARVGAVDEVGAIDDATERPQLAVASILALVGDDITERVGIRREGAGEDLEGARVGPGERDHRGAPVLGLPRAPVVVVGRLVDGVIALDVVDDEAPAEGLLVERLCLVGGARLPGVGAGLEAGDVLGSGQWQQVAELGGVEHEARRRGSHA